MDRSDPLRLLLLVMVAAIPVTFFFSVPWAMLFFGPTWWLVTGAREHPSAVVRWSLGGGIALILVEIVWLVRAPG